MKKHPILRKTKEAAQMAVFAYACADAVRGLYYLGRDLKDAAVDKYYDRKKAK